MTDFKLKFDTAVAMTKTNANLASSATAGWKGPVFDNTTSLYEDILVSLELAAVNTAPGGGKLIKLFGYSLIEGTAYSGTGAAAIDGNEGTVTFPDYTTLPMNLPELGNIPYTTQNVAIISPAFSMAACFGGWLPPKCGAAMINHSGMTLNVTNIYYIPVFHTGL